jgi:phage FluMu protein Com
MLMQPGPGGAQCALHAGVGANFVCARCGNFMCVGCSLNGTETQCPTCRELNPIGFPYDANADIGTLWSHTTASFQREMTMCIVGGLLFFAFVAGGGIVSNIINSIVSAILGVEVDPANPFRNLSGFGVNFVIGQLVGTVVNMAVQGIALVGFYRMLMDVLVGKKADLGRMFSQLHLLPQYLAMHLIMFFAITVPSFLYFGLVGVVGGGLVGLQWSRMADFRFEKLLNPAVIALFLGSLVVFMIAMIVVLPVTLFSTPELIVGNCGPVEALKRSWELGEGQRLRVFGYSFVVGLIVMAGAFACGVGLIVAMPVAYMLILALFLALRRSSSLPQAIH